MLNAFYLDTFDLPKLERDLRAVNERGDLWFEKPEVGKYSGARYIGWSVLPLHSLHGKLTEHRGTLEKDYPNHRPTALLDLAPYIKEILDALPAQKLRVRLMRLKADGHIHPHRDPQAGLMYPIVRLHVPIVSNDKVRFIVGGEEIRMKLGELWYVDTTQIHEVHNDGDEDRIHLVIDLANSESLRDHISGRHLKALSSALA